MTPFHAIAVAAKTDDFDAAGEDVVRLSGRALLGRASGRADGNARRATGASWAHRLRLRFADGIEATRRFVRPALLT